MGVIAQVAGYSDSSLSVEGCIFRRSKNLTLGVAHVGVERVQSSELALHVVPEICWIEGETRLGGYSESYAFGDLAA